MAKLKNALRQHFIADRKRGEETPPKEYLSLAKNVYNIEASHDEKTESTADYSGDGTEKEEVTGIVMGYTFTGNYDAEEKSHVLLREKQFALGENRDVWHKIISADGKKVIEGKATLSDLVTDGGDATAYETLSGAIKFVEIPKRKENEEDEE